MKKTICIALMSLITLTSVAMNREEFLQDQQFQKRRLKRASWTTVPTLVHTRGCGTIVKDVRTRVYWTVFHQNIANALKNLAKHADCQFSGFFCDQESQIVLNAPPLATRKSELLKKDPVTGQTLYQLAEQADKALHEHNAFPTKILLKSWHIHMDSLKPE